MYFAVFRAKRIKRKIVHDNLNRVVLYSGTVRRPIRSVGLLDFCFSLFSKLFILICKQNIKRPRYRGGAWQKFSTAVRRVEKVGAKTLL